jgi:hypothetical protein
LFRLAGKMEMLTWGQLAIDTADAVMADAVYREVTTRTVADRPFLPAEFISNLRNAEFDEAQDILKSVRIETERAQAVLERFESASGAPSLNRMANALRDRKVQPSADEDDVFDELGGIKEGYLRRVNLQGGR